MKIVLYASQLHGHPAIYVSTFLRVFRECGHEVSTLSGNNCSDTDWVSPAEQLTLHSSVNNAGPGRDSTESPSASLHNQIVSYLEAQSADMLLLIDADSCQDMLTSIADGTLAPLPCFSAGIFSRTAEWCPGEPFYFQKKPSWATNARFALGKLKRLIMRNVSPEKIFFDRTVCEGQVLDLAIVKDERVVQKKGRPFIWMPEIYENLMHVENEDIPEAEQTVYSFLKNYGANDPRELLLFYGAGAWYKGYDYFLKLADLDPNVIAVHIGTPEHNEPGKNWDFNTAKLRENLGSQGRLLETSVFASPAITVEAFSKIRRFVSFHRLTGSSGTVLQSLANRKPVLTPSGGLIGYRTRSHHLGLTYRALDIDNLLSTWQRFKAMPAAKFENAIVKYIDLFSYDAKKEFVESLVQRVNGDIY